jgi:hypothetical protein
MAYLINKSDGTALLTIEDGVLDTSTSIGLLGRNYTGYGEIQNENFVFLLENFSNNNPPTRPIRGQSWYDSASGRMNVYTGTEWAPISSATISELPPSEFIGALWLRPSSQQLSIFNGNVWTVIGPEAVPGFGETRAMSSILKDTNNTDHAVILMKINGQVQGIWCSESFSINVSNSIDGFFDLIKGLNVAGSSTIQGSLSGNASTASKLATTRTINGVSFDGSSDITVTANTTNSLIRGTYLTGSNFNGSLSTTWSVDALSSNSIGTVVARDSNGSFAANTITATNFIGTLSGNVNVATGTSGFNNIIANEVDGKIFTGRAARASRLDVGRTINNIVFDGSQNIVVSANAETLTGTFIKDTVVTSNLEQVGTLNSLSILDQGLVIGTGNSIQIIVESNIPTIRASGKIDLILSNDGPSLSFVTPNDAFSQGGPLAPAILSNNFVNLGVPTKKFDNVYANNFVGNALSASTLLNSRTINGIAFNGSQNIVIFDNTKLPLTGGTITGSVVANGNISVPTASLTFGTTNTLSVGVNLNIPTISSTSQFDIVVGSQGPNITFAPAALAASLGGPLAPAILSNNLTNLGGPSKPFDTVYANNLIGNASTATVLQTSRTINGVLFNGSQNITIVDNTKLPLTGGTISGTLVVNNPIIQSQVPTENNHLVNKLYVDTSKIVETIFNAGNTGTTLTLNWNNGTIQTVTANSNFTLALPINMPSGASLTAIITQDSSGNRRLTAASGYVFASGYKTLSTQPNTVDLLNIFKAGSIHFVTLTTGYA